MRLHLAFALLFLIATSSFAALYPPIAEVGISIPELVSKSAFVCKGEIISAPEARFTSAQLPRKTGMATFRVDRCFKGDLTGDVTVAADEYLPSAGWGGGGHIFIPKAGEYLLLFLNGKEGVFGLADENRGALPVSRLTSRNASDSNPLDGLEDDFNAGMSDPNPDVVLKSVFWLGCMEHLHSTAVLHDRLLHADDLEKLYLWEALLSVGDRTVIPSVAEYLYTHPPEFRMFFLPADRLPHMSGRVFAQLCGTPDPLVIPYLTRFTESPEPRIRVAALRGLRRIGDLGSAAVFLRELDDHNEDMDFIAMQSLLELAGGGSIDWVENGPGFQADPEYYAQRCREWWIAEGLTKAKARFSHRFAGSAR